MIWCHVAALVKEADWANLNGRGIARRCYVEKVAECYQIFSRLISKRKRTCEIIESFFQPNRLASVKKYSWENEESKEFEAQAIAESWMIYVGIEACDSWCSFNWGTMCMTCTIPERNSFDRERASVFLNIKAVHVNIFTNYNVVSAWD